MVVPAATHPVVPPSLVRRVVRVRERFSLQPDHLDEVFDDFFVLWRAFESTVEGTDRRAYRAEDAVVETLGWAQHRARDRGSDLGTVAPRMLAWCHDLRLFHRVHDGQLARWFGEEELASMQAHDIRARLTRLSTAARAPERWHDRDSRDAGWTMYRLRCAVFHANVETSDSVALRLAPLACAAFIELGALRAAFLARGDAADGWRLVGGADDL